MRTFIAIKYFEDFRQVTVCSFCFSISADWPSLTVPTVINTVYSVQSTVRHIHCVQWHLKLHLTAYLGMRPICHFCHTFGCGEIPPLALNSKQRLRREGGGTCWKTVRAGHICSSNEFQVDPQSFIDMQQARFLSLITIFMILKWCKQEVLTGVASEGSNQPIYVKPLKFTLHDYY